MVQSSTRSMASDTCIVVASAQPKLGSLWRAAWSTSDTRAGTPDTTVARPTTFWKKIYGMGELGRADCPCRHCNRTGGLCLPPWCSISALRGICTSAFHVHNGALPLTENGCVKRGLERISAERAGLSDTVTEENWRWPRAVVYSV